jgi:hypothetical protein
VPSLVEARPPDAEAVAQLARKLYDDERHHTREVGARLARAREPGYLALLERLAENAEARAEAEHGRTRRTERAMGKRAESLTLQGFREAYNCADRGAPNPAFEWLYGAVAVWGGWTAR